jgi:hypothetical protein
MAEYEGLRGELVVATDGAIRDCRGLRPVCSADMRAQHRTGLDLKAHVVSSHVQDAGEIDAGRRHQYRSTVPPPAARHSAIAAVMAAVFSVRPSPLPPWRSTLHTRGGAAGSGGGGRAPGTWLHAGRRQPLTIGANSSGLGSSGWETDQQSARAVSSGAMVAIIATIAIHNCCGGSARNTVSVAAPVPDLRGRAAIPGSRRCRRCGGNISISTYRQEFSAELIFGRNFIAAIKSLFYSCRAVL